LIREKPFWDGRCDFAILLFFFALWRSHHVPTPKRLRARQMPARRNSSVRHYLIPRVWSIAFKPASNAIMALRPRARSHARSGVRIDLNSQF
jgi:hypothetical protein